MIKKTFYSSEELKTFLDEHHHDRCFALAYFPEAPELGETIYFSNDLRSLLTKVIGFAENGVRLIEAAPGFWTAANLNYPLAPIGANNLDEARDLFWERIAEAVRCEGFEALLFEKGGRSLETYCREWQILESVRIHHEQFHARQKGITQISDLMH